MGRSRGEICRSPNRHEGMVLRRLAYWRTSSSSLPQLPAWRTVRPCVRRSRFRALSPPPSLSGPLPLSSIMIACFRSASRQRRALSVLADCSAASEACKVKLADRGYVKGLRVLDEATIAGLRARLPLLFRGEFDTGVYPDEMHWREGISRQDAPREVCVCLRVSNCCLFTRPGRR